MTGKGEKPTEKTDAFRSRRLLRSDRRFGRWPRTMKLLPVGLLTCLGVFLAVCGQSPSTSGKSSNNSPASTTGTTTTTSTTTTTTTTTTLPTESTVPGATQALHGTVDDTNYNYTADGDTVGGSCGGTGSTDDPMVVVGTQVGITAPGGETSLGKAYLSPGTWANASTSRWLTGTQEACEFTFNVHVPIAPQYDIYIGASTDPVNYTLAELQQDDWTIGIAVSTSSTS